MFSRLQPTPDEALKRNDPPSLQQREFDLEQSALKRRAVTVNPRPAPKSQPSSRQALSFQAEDSEKARLAKLQPRPQTDVSPGQARPRFVVAPTCGVLAYGSHVGNLLLLQLAFVSHLQPSDGREPVGNCPAKPEAELPKPTPTPACPFLAPLSLHPTVQSRAAQSGALPMRCVAEPYSAVQCSAVQSRAVQGRALPVRFGAEPCKAVQCKVHCTAPHRTAQQCTVQCTVCVRV